MYSLAIGFSIIVSLKTFISDFVYFKYENISGLLNFCIILSLRNYEDTQKKIKKHCRIHITIRNKVQLNLNKFITKKNLFRQKTE